MHDPEGVEGDFGGYEVLRKIGAYDLQNSWQSVINLTTDLRKYELRQIEPSTKHAVTVRGRVLPDSYSEMADPLVFETMKAGLSPPLTTCLLICS